MRVVLVADDEHSFREAVKRLVQAEHEPIEVYEAGNGDEAVAMARQLHPDAVLLDLSMPGCNGFQAARRIRLEWPNARILVCSVHSHSSYRAAALAAGADDFLAKKTLAAELAPRLHRLWGRTP
jgi:DNA-binding NarL/FixJ family response regulator